MSLSTQSRFFFGHEITSDNFMLDVDEGSGEITAELSRGSYTATEFAAEVKRALDAAGDLTYTVTLDRTTRLITISASANVDLLTNTGSHVGSSAWDLIGFSTLVDHTGDDTYVAESQTGQEYHTQFVPQSYVSPENLQSSVDSTVLQSASGEVQVVRFGTNRFIEMNLTFITDRNVSGSIIRNSATGLTDAQNFLQFAVSKNRMEFMEDADDPSEFFSVLLESTQDDSKGVGYRLRELYGKGLPGFFETGILKFRVLE